MGLTSSDWMTDISEIQVLGLNGESLAFENVDRARFNEAREWFEIETKEGIDILMRESIMWIRLVPKATSETVLEDAYGNEVKLYV